MDRVPVLEATDNWIHTDHGEHRQRQLSESCVAAVPVLSIDVLRPEMLGPGVRSQHFLYSKGS